MLSSIYYIKLCNYVLFLILKFQAVPYLFNVYYCLFNPKKRGVIKYWNFEHPEHPEYPEYPLFNKDSYVRFETRFYYYYRLLHIHIKDVLLGIRT